MRGIPFLLAPSFFQFGSVHANPVALSPTNFLPRATCHDYVLVSSRGTGEPQGPSLGFTNTIKYTLANVTNGIEYDTVYPANADPSSSVVGGTDVINHINTGLLACPHQKYALLGYSQGAIVVLRALKNFTDTHNMAAKSAIQAVWMIGNPVQKPNQTVTFDEFGGNTTRAGQGALYSDEFALSQCWVNSGKVKEICYTGDPVCLGLSVATTATIGAHFLYPFDQNVQDMGAQWLISHLKK